MAIAFTPLHPVIAAECSGIDIGRTLTKDEAEVIDAGMDNRVTMHRGRRYEDDLYPRDLRRTTLTDGVPTVEQEEAQAMGV